MLGIFMFHDLNTFFSYVADVEVPISTPSVFNISVQIENNFVPLLFLVCEIQLYFI
jgi:hypothetical protein